MLGGKKTFAVIRAVYENRYSPEEFVRELDFVLEKNVNVVIIEPDELGEVTWRWIRTGNWLHKTAVLSGKFKHCVVNIRQFHSGILSRDVQPSIVV